MAPGLHPAILAADHHVTTNQAREDHGNRNKAENFVGTQFHETFPSNWDSRIGHLQITLVFPRIVKEHTESPPE